LDQPEREAAVKRALKALDQSAKRGIIHSNNAARRKSRLMKRLNAAS
jgi:small subunit ribosomal protein S20